MLYVVSRGGNRGDDGIFIPLNVGIDAQENAPGCQRSRDTQPNNSENFILCSFLILFGWNTKIRSGKHFHTLRRRQHSSRRCSLFHGLRRPLHIPRVPPSSASCS